MPASHDKHATRGLAEHGPERLPLHVDGGGFLPFGNRRPRPIAWGAALAMVQKHSQTKHMSWRGHTLSAALALDRVGPVHVPLTWSDLPSQFASFLPSKTKEINE